MTKRGQDLMPIDYRDPHPLTWPIIVGVGGLLLGVGGSVVYIGGALKTVEINSHRLDTLEQTGSPIVQALKADLQSMRVTLTELTRQTERTTDVIGERGKMLASHEETLKQLSADVRTLEEFSRQTSERRAALAAQVAADEGRMMAIERILDDIRASQRRLRDDFQTHQRDEDTKDQTELNQLRNALLRKDQLREKDK